MPDRKVLSVYVHDKHTSNTVFYIHTDFMPPVSPPFMPFMENKPLFVNFFYEYLSSLYLLAYLLVYHIVNFMS